MIPLPCFDEFFRALWPPYDPFPWQSMLAEQVAADCWPNALDLPTAAGKTACIDAAIYALAAQADKPVAERTAPRRIWFVVDRRIVVDEAFDRASTIAKKLVDATGGVLKAVADRLRRIAGTERPLAVARLRGGVLRDDNWARLPSQPAVITSTVDQLGSRLLFRGYGPSKLTAPIFAGLAAHDSLILLDEAHCSVPFLQTLRSIETYRGGAWAESPLATPFAFAILSATLPSDIPPASVFPGAKRRGMALNHQVLRDRLTASKPAELVSLKPNTDGADSLVTAAAEHALGYIEQHGKCRVAVIVNRVRTAKAIAKSVGKESGDTVQVVLLTGRLRAYERDRHVERWKPILKAVHPEKPEKPVVLVSTQCVEVGADFSFDALVTEAASLDALRQRFGRLNRMGAPGAAPATILIREPETKPGQTDPVYGTAIPECWRLLNEKAVCVKEGKKERRTIDFGFDSLDKRLSDIVDFGPFLAPRPNAPFLLPAHLDLLCQTAPTPQPEPDVQLFLHGTDRGVPEVRLVWRTDLLEARTESWLETIAFCPPNSGEMLSAPLHAVRAWLADPAATDEDASDVEGVSRPGEGTADGDLRIRPVLVWRGRDRSRVRRRASAIRPDDVVIIPSEYGLPELGQAQPAEALGADRIDLWEPSRSASARPKALRVHRNVLEPWIECPPVNELVSLAEDPASDREEIWAAVDAVVEYLPARDGAPAAPPEWLREILHAVRNGRIESHPDKGLILFSRGQPSWRVAEPDLFADDDDLLSVSDQAMNLADHSARVEWAVKQIATRCLPNAFLGPLERAAYWHDAGKLDDRFQTLLYEGDEVAALAGEALAKSADMPASPARQRAIREASGLPAGFRHEMLSYQLAERFAALPDDDAWAELILHLIASHHGHARPFAPVIPDLEPPAVLGSHDGIDIELGAAQRAKLIAPHALSSGLSDRFWRLTRRYGWWGLAYLEAVLRLADWYGSVPGEGVGIERAPMAPLRIAPQGTEPRPIEPAMALTGLDGANPLGFLGALGALMVIRQKVCTNARLS
jgi:CRISPR-associated endonuclease/helicase Cas3